MPRPGVHRVAQPGDAGLQLQHLVLHGPPLLPLPHGRGHPLLVPAGLAGRPGLPGGLPPLPAAQAVCQGRRRHSK